MVAPKLILQVQVVHQRRGEDAGKPQDVLVGPIVAIRPSGRIAEGQTALPVVDVSIVAVAEKQALFGTDAVIHAKTDFLALEGAAIGSLERKQRGRVGLNGQRLHLVLILVVEKEE